MPAAADATHLVVFVVLFQRHFFFFRIAEFEACGSSQLI